MKDREDLLRRAKEYAEFFEATKNFNTLGFFNDLIGYLDAESNAIEVINRAVEVVKGVELQYWESSTIPVVDLKQSVKALEQLKQEYRDGE